MRMKNMLMAFGLVFFTQVALAQDTVDLAECQIAGIDFTDDLEQAENVLGEPTHLPPPCVGCTDTPHSWIGYEGLKIWHSYGEIFRFEVSSPKYRLRSGVGVDSSRTEVVTSFGEGRIRVSNGVELITYSITSKNGQATRLVLEFALSDEVVSAFEITPR